MSLAQEFLKEIEASCGHQNIQIDEATRWSYSYDNSRQYSIPDAVVFAQSHEQVVSLVKSCLKFNAPLTCRGAGTGTAGASVPVNGGIVLSFEHMDRLLELDTANRYMVVEPGIKNQQIQQAAAQAGFFWPPDPTSSAVCTVGGNLACNAAGPRAVKYGTTRENVLSLKVVTGKGETLITGTKTTKGVVGYDLTRLLIGSEGTLAIITEATLKLTPLPSDKQTLQITYDSILSAAQAVADIMAQPVTPCALEFIDKNAIEMIRDYARIPLPENAGAMLMIELDGTPAAIEEGIHALIATAKNQGCLEVKKAVNQEEIKALWEVRKALSPALRKIAPKKINEDVVVPVSKIPELIEQLDRFSENYKIPIVNFGHAGNGNIHVNLLADPENSEQMISAERCLESVFELVLKLGGTLSGEHGIGLVKRDDVSKELDQTQLAYMKAIKQQFDPYGILNPLKSLPIY